MKKKSLLTLFTVTMILMLVCVLAMTASATTASTETVTASSSLCTHSMFDTATGRCSDCNAAIAEASVTIMGSEVFYKTIEKAFEEVEDCAAYLQAVVKLYRDVAVTKSCIIDGAFTLDLNGCTLENTDKYKRILNIYGDVTVIDSGEDGTLKAHYGILVNGKLTVTDGAVLGETFGISIWTNGSVIVGENAEISAVSKCFEVRGGSLRMTGGSATGEDAICYDEPLSVSIEGGTIKGRIRDAGDVNAAPPVITGGNFPDGISLDAGEVYLPDLIGEGCAYYVDGTPVAVAADAKTLGGNVTVKICSHEGAFDRATGKCLLCGRFVAAANLSVPDDLIYFQTLEDAITEAKSNDASTIMLLMDCTASKSNCFEIYGGRFIIDLNGYRLLPSDAATVSLVTYSGNVMLANHKEVGGTTAMIYLFGGTLTINGGVYENNIETMTSSATLIIEKGSFSLVKNYDGTLTVKGGEFDRIDTRERSVASALPADYYFYGSDGNVITPADATALADVTVKKGAVITKEMIALESATYNGSNQMPSVTVTVGGVELRQNVHYSLVTDDGASFIGAGSYEIRILGEGIYTGDVSLTYIIEKASPVVTSPTVNENLIYNGYELGLVSAGSTTGGTLVYKIDDDDWNSHCEARIQAGTYTVYYKVIGGENFMDTAEQSLTVTIAPIRMEHIALTLEYNSVKYDGNAKTPKLAPITAGNLILTEGVDYMLHYTNNMNVGTAVLTVTFAGNCTGEAQATFLIIKRDVTAPLFEGLNSYYEYTGDAIRPAFTLKDDLGNTIPESEYTLAYANNIELGMATVTVTDNAGGNYAVSGTASFEVHRHERNEGEITKHPTCTEKGTKRYLCVHDGVYMSTEDIEAQGHSYDNACDGDCNVCGETRTVSDHTDADENGLCDVCNREIPKDGLSVGAIVGIAIGAVAAAGLGGFALLWFVIKKKTWSDLAGAFKK